MPYWADHLAWNRMNSTVSPLSSHFLPDLSICSRIRMSQAQHGVSVQNRLLCCLLHLAWGHRCHLLRSISIFGHVASISSLLWIFRGPTPPTFFAGLRFWLISLGACQKGDRDVRLTFTMYSHLVCRSLRIRWRCRTLSLYPFGITIDCFANVSLGEVPELPHWISTKSRIISGTTRSKSNHSIRLVRLLKMKGEEDKR